MFSWQRKPPLYQTAWRREESCPSSLPPWAQGVEQKYEYIKERTSYILAKHEQLIQIQTSPFCTTVSFSRFILHTIFSFRNLSISAIEKCLRASAFLPCRYAKCLSKHLVWNLVARGQYFLSLYFDLILQNRWSKICGGWAVSSQLLQILNDYTFNLAGIVSQEVQYFKKRVICKFSHKPLFHGKSPIFNPNQVIVATHLDTPLPCL